MEQNEQYTYIDMANVLVKARSLRDQVKLKTENTFQRYSPTIKKYQELESLLDETLQYVRAFIGDVKIDEQVEETTPEDELRSAMTDIADMLARCNIYPRVSNIPAPFTSALEDTAETISAEIDTNPAQPSELDQIKARYKLGPRQVVTRFLSGINLAEEHKGEYPEYAMRCATLLQNWFVSRYLENSRLNYNSSAIAPAVDKFIFAYGAACQAGEEGDFIFKLNQWIVDLKHKRSGNYYHIPYFIQVKYDSEEPADYTWQAIVIEQCIKPYIYTDGFNLDLMNTVRSKVVSLNPDALDEIPGGATN